MVLLLVWWDGRNQYHSFHKPLYTPTWVAHWEPKSLQQCLWFSDPTSIVEWAHKCIHNLQDSSVNLSKMRLTLNCLEYLKEELDGIEKTQVEIKEIWEYVHVLDGGHPPGSQEASMVTYFLSHIWWLSSDFILFWTHKIDWVNERPDNKHCHKCRSYKSSLPDKKKSTNTWIWI